MWQYLPAKSAFLFWPVEVNVEAPGNWAEGSVTGTSLRDGKSASSAKHRLRQVDKSKKYHPLYTHGCGPLMIGYACRKCFFVVGLHLLHFVYDLKQCT